MKPSPGDDHHLWRFVTNHTLVLEAIVADPTVRLRDIAADVGITERTVSQIVDDLEKAGYLTRIPNGRRNSYEVHVEMPLRHPRYHHRNVGELISFLEAPAKAATRRKRS
jgi:predicted transcriptional regulator